MPIIDNPELPTIRIPIRGPGVDALEARKECGSPVNLEDTIKLPARDWFVRTAKAWKLLGEPIFARSR